MADVQHMLSTIDNPFNPFTQYDEWLRYDEDLGYNSNALLARVTVTSDDLPDTLQDKARELAIDEIVLKDPSGMYVRISDPSAELQSIS